MTVRKLDKSDWQRDFDALSHSLEGKQAEIEVASLKLGAQVEADWLPLLGISYDPKDDVLDIALEGVDHLIENPREIYVDATVADLMSLEIVDAEGARQIVRLKEPLMLPPPHG